MGPGGFLFDPDGERERGEKEWMYPAGHGCTAGIGKRNLVFMTIGPFLRTEDCLGPT